jgi:hypothetical protein
MITDTTEETKTDETTTDETKTDETKTNDGTGNPEDDLENDFEKFNQNISNHQIEQPEDNDDPENLEIDLSDAENFKLQIFLSLMFALLDGLHVFVYKFMTKYKITREDIALDETDKAGLEIYFRTQKVMDLINRLPVEIIGFFHIEYMYFNKFQDFKKKAELEEPEEEEEENEEPEEPEEEEEEEEEEKKAPAKKAAKKAAPKKAAKKKPAKKAAKKAAAKKEDTKPIEEKK